MTLRPAQPPGTPPAIEIPSGERCFTGYWVGEGLMLTNLPYEAEHIEVLRHESVDLVLNMCEDGEYRTVSVMPWRPPTTRAASARIARTR